MQAYIPGIHPGRPGNAFFASGGDLLQKNAHYFRADWRRREPWRCFPSTWKGLYDNIYIILALVATAVTLLLSVDFRAVINLSSNDSKSQDGTGEYLHPALLACVGITSLCKASNLVELFVSWKCSP